MGVNNERMARRLREQSGYGLRELARELGADPMSLYRFEMGWRLLREDRLNRYRDAVSRRLNRPLSLDDLLREDPDKERQP